MPAFLTATGLAKLLQKVKTVFATKSEVSTLENDVASTYLPLAGGTITGTIEHATSSDTGFSVAYNGKRVRFMVGSGHTNRGLWDDTLNKWIVYANNSNCFLNGNASTATKLATARTINDVSFDGSANITVADSTKLPLAGGTLTGFLTSKVASGAVYKIVNTGITKGSDSISAWTYIPFVDKSESESNEQGRLGYVGFQYNKKAITGTLTAYNGTTATNTAKARLAVGYDASGNVFTEAPTPAVADSSTKIATTAWARTATGNFACNAASATKLATARTINGVSFNGTANITVADSTKLPLAGGALTGSLRCTAKYTSADTTYTSDLLTFNSGNNSYGNNVALGGGGNTIIGGGESYSAQLSALAGNGAEACYVCADNAIYLKSNCNTFANAKTTTIGTDGKVACPQGFVGTIAASSDIRLKKDIESISSKMLDAWDGIEWVQFKFKADDSKMHFGIIAQDLNKRLADSGIEASSCTIAESNPNYDPATMDELPEALTVNYIEALVIEAAYLRRKCRMLEDRISALEAMS